MAIGMPKVGRFNLMDALLISGSKMITERIAAPYIGNGTLKSGAIKGAAGYAAGKFIGGKYGNIVATGLIVDAAEDVLTGFLGNAPGFGFMSPTEPVMTI